LDKRGTTQPFFIHPNYIFKHGFLKFNEPVKNPPANKVLV
jgi:hypothetical protein